MKPLITSIIILLAVMSFSLPQGICAEDPKSAIKTAESFLLDGDRLKASQTLIEYIGQATDPSVIDRARKKLDQLTTVFLSEEAQKKYHYGKSVSDPALALESFSDAIKLEKGNLELLNRKSEMELVLGLCEDTVKTAERALLFNPYDIESNFRKGQGLICSRKFDEFDIWALEVNSKKLPEDYFKLLVAQRNYFSDEIGKALGVLEESLRISPDFSEPWYWKAQVLKKTNSSFIQETKKYIELCSKKKSELLKRYSYDPRVCSQADRAEKELASMEGESA